ncbi:hypothetical protein F66182_14800, partial [Fusarium sp. NRRL 66182]
MASALRDTDFISFNDWHQSGRPWFSSDPSWPLTWASFVDRVSVHLPTESNVDWLVADDQLSVTSSIGGLSASAPEFVPDMSPHDILRSVLGDKKTNDEIEAALEANSYDLGATIAALSEDPGKDGSQKSDEGRVV